MIKSHVQPTGPSPKPKVANDILPKRLSFDIPQIDGALDIADKGSICVTSRDGWHANTLVTRLCVRALMSRRHGGFDSPSVVFIDAGNCSDIYQCVDFARQYGMNDRQALDRIVVSRPFTIHQLAGLVIHELVLAVRRSGAKLVVISDLLHLFAQDPQIDADEAKWLVQEIVKHLQRLARRVMLIVSVVSQHLSEILMPVFDSRIDLDTVSDSALEVKVASGDSNYHQPLPVQALELVPAR